MGKLTTFKIGKVSVTNYQKEIRSLIRKHELDDKCTTTTLRLIELFSETEDFGKATLYAYKLLK